VARAGFRSDTGLSEGRQIEILAISMFVLAIAGLLVVLPWLLD
jgi:hypothetical protein